ncbi:MAG: 1-deoxy-D-xylulose-5-phosphate synthase [Clostridia bacterium]|nr:1-deoxy-D-xylulose-5-phosphate synthase [Clostridia bacterium]
MDEYKLLNNIKSPSDIKKFNNEETDLLCKEIRTLLINTVSENGGHLASNLGTVELTVALHKCFDSPNDAIIFDVGHQAYTHKLLTGRFDKFSTLRKKGGISGFTRPEESEHDIFYSGHAGVAVSQAAGIAEANKIKGNKNFAVAVIGDGSFAGGMVYEALNAAGSSDKRLIVILNDNEMSISQNVGALAHNLARVRAKPEYYRFKAGTEKFLNKIPVIGKSFSNHLFRLKTALKNILYSSSFFEDFGFRYMGPIDGHDIDLLCDVFNAAKMVEIPVLIHVNTVKGRGFDLAEKSPENYHGISPAESHFDKEKNEIDTFSSVFGKYLCTFAEKDKRICAVTAAMSIGTGLESFAEKYPERFFDVGIAEEHAVTFCSGLSAAGLIPVFAVYSTFLQRCFDQLIHDGALQKRKMIIAVDRAGFVGSDGETHQGIYDISMLSGIPGTTVYSPSSYIETGHYFYRALYKDSGVVIIRYPKGCQPLLPEDFKSSENDFDIFGNTNSEITVVTYGRLFADVLSLSKKYNIKIVKLNKIKPLNPKLFEVLKKCNNIIFFEECVKSGSVGEKFASVLLEQGYKGRFSHKAIDDCFVAQATVSDQMHNYGLDFYSIEKYIIDNMNGA